MSWLKTLVVTVLKIDVITYEALPVHTMLCHHSYLLLVGFVVSCQFHISLTPPVGASSAPFGEQIAWGVLI